MDTLINGRRVYVYFPYPADNVVELAFPDGEKFKMPSKIWIKMGYTTVNLPYGDKRETK